MHKFESVYITLIFILERMLTAIFNKIVDNKILRWKLNDVPKLYLPSTLFLCVHEIKISLWKMSECARKQNKLVQYAIACWIRMSITECRGVSST